MTPELWKALIGACVLFLGEGAALLKVYKDLLAVKSSRAETAERRDAEATAVRDNVQQLQWENARLKEDLMMVKTHLDDHQLQLSNVVTEIAKLGVKMDNVLDALNKLQEAK